jgi:excisionase family DNA binding protein
MPGERDNCAIVGVVDVHRHSPPSVHLVHVEEAARRAGVGRGFLYQQIGQGRLRARKAGRRTLIALTDLAAWLEALPTLAAEAPNHDR